MFSALRNLILASLIMLRVYAGEDSPTVLVPQILQAKGDDKLPLLIRLEESRRKIQPEERKKFDDEILEAMTKASPKRPLPNLCEALCNLVNNANDWVNSDEFSRKTKGGKKDVRDEDLFAIGGLTFLFVLKAAPYCTSANNLVTQYFQDWKNFEAEIKGIMKGPPKKTIKAPAENKGKEKKENQLEGMGELMTPSLVSDVLDELGKKQKDKKHFRTNTLYSRIFFDLTSQELVNHFALEPTNKTQIQTYVRDNSRELTLLQNRMDELSSESRDFMFFVGGDSAFNLFALSASSVSAPRVTDKVRTRLKLISEKIPTPLSLPYGLSADPNAESRSNDPERAASGRAGPFYLARYRSEPDPVKKSEAIDHFIEALENFERYAPILKLIMGTSATHLPPDGLASYYYYPALAYIVGGVRYLLGNATLNDGQREKLQAFSEKLKTETLSVIGEDGLFPAMGSFAPYAKAASNALGGLALVAQADHCPRVEGMPKFPSYGILEEMFFKDLPDTLATPLNKNHKVIR